MEQHKGGPVSAVKEEDRDGRVRSSRATREGGRYLSTGNGHRTATCLNGMNSPPVRLENDGETRVNIEQFRDRNSAGSG